MKRILITGANSYIGTSFCKIMSNFKDEYIIDTIDMTEDTWRNKDFSQYDCVFHVAGIAHIKETKKNAYLYYKVNRDLAIETAKKAKTEGVKHFIILSSLSVYGMQTGFITKNTVPYPTTNYGRSKLQADEAIIKLNDEKFSVTIVRPPMVYGKGCKGNYATLSKYAVKLPVFPNVNNQRSMIYIDNLCIFIKSIIENTSVGMFFPQNNEYVCTSNMVQEIALTHGKNIKLVKIFNPIIKLIQVGVFRKIFGNLIIDKMDLCDAVPFRQSIIETEKNDAKKEE